MIDRAMHLVECALSAHFTKKNGEIQSKCCGDLHSVRVDGWMLSLVLGANLTGDKCGLSRLARRQGPTL